MVIRIDELVLHGLAPGDEAAFTRAFGRELASLLESGSASPWPAGAIEGGTVDAGTVTLPHHATPAAAGVEVAQAVHRGLSGRRP